MTMTKTKIRICLLAGALALAAAGCGSDSDSCGDGGCPDAGRDTAADGGGLFGLSAGDSCFAITAIAPGASDGCMLGVAALPAMMVSLPVNYTVATGTISVGTMGSLGSGPIVNNMGTLTRENDPTDPATPGCMWHQVNTTQLTLLANNKFTVNVTEMQTNITAACMAGFTMCTSTWTWTMEKSTKTPPGCL